MKKYNKTTTPHNPDRIEKAITLIENGKVMTANNGTFRVLTDRFAGGYTVTITSCDCADFEGRKAKGDDSACKHMWAAIGATAAMLIGEIRKAASLPALQAIGKSYADAMQSLPEPYVTIARNEYKARRDALTKANRDDEALQILIKPQPKSNGSYGAIEI